MATTSNRIQRAFSLAAQLIQRRFPLLLALLFADAAITIFVEDRLALMTPAEENQRWVLQLIMGVWGLFEGIFLFLALSWGIPKGPRLNPAVFQPNPFSQPYLPGFFAEYLRMLAQVLLWTLLLLLPGIYRYCQLIFVPFVALFAKSYSEGQIDALELAKKLSKGRMSVILIVFLLSTAAALGLEFLPQLSPGLHIAPLRIFFLCLSLLISIWTYSFIFNLFVEAMEQGPKE